MFHGGKQDWGTGPGGKGKLLRIRYSDPEMPQPLATVTSSEGEVRITFDSPLDPRHLRHVAARTAIRYGESVAAGDRLDSLRPGDTAAACAEQPALSDSTESLMRQVVDDANLEAAWKNVKRNRGAAGHDGITIANFPEWFRPKRSAHGAAKHVRDTIRRGYRFVADIELSKFSESHRN